MAAPVFDGNPDRDELAQSRAIDVLHAGKIQNETAVAVIQESIHLVAQRQIHYPQPAKQIQDDDLRVETGLDDKGHICST